MSKRKKPRSADAVGHPAKSRPITGFTVTLQVLSALPVTECRRIERCLEDHAEAHGLVLHGHQLRQFVTAREHDISANDQVALIDRLVDVPGLVAVYVGAIGHEAEEPGQDEPFVLARTGDVALIGLTLLYRCGRVSASTYMQILGGFDRPTNFH